MNEATFASGCGESGGSGRVDQMWKDPSSEPSSKVTESDNQTSASWVCPTEKGADIRSKPLEARNSIRYSQPQATPAPFENERKRRKTGSFFYRDRTEALDPSLVRPTSPIEQENNILIVQDIGKQRQIAVKDHGIQVRDNRIRDQEQKIAELELDINNKDSIILTNTRENELRTQHIRELNQIILDQQDQNQSLANSINEHVESLEQSNQAVEEHTVLLRQLFSELLARKAEVQSLKNQPLLDQNLRWLRGVIRSAIPFTSATATTAFPFLRLPGEIRNKIYVFCLVSPRPIDFWPMQPLGATDANFDRMGIYKHATRSLNTALIRTCLQVYHEASSILYGLNRFRFSDRGAWPLLCGFLHHIGNNYVFLTNVTIGFPTWCSIKYGDNIVTGPAKAVIEEQKQAMLRRFGNAILDSPTGPPSDCYTAWSEACKILLKIPLDQFTIVIPHDVQIPAFGSDAIFNMLTDDSDYADTTEIFFHPKRLFVFLRRDASQPNFRNGVWFNVDDDLAMGREHLKKLCRGTKSRFERDMQAKMKKGRYGKAGQGVSFWVDGGEARFEVLTSDVECVEKGQGFVLFRALGAIRRALGW